jgi:hypothetical protein
MPKRGLSLKKPLPEIRKILANDINMNIRNFGKQQYLLPIFFLVLQYVGTEINMSA